MTHKIGQKMIVKKKTGQRFEYLGSVNAEKEKQERKLWKRNEKEIRRKKEKNKKKQINWIVKKQIRTIYKEKEMKEGKN